MADEGATNGNGSALDVNKLVITIALLLGAGGGVVGLTTNDEDRYTGAQSAADRAAAAAERKTLQTIIVRNSRDIGELTLELRKLAEDRPPPSLLKRVDKLESKIYKLEIEHASVGHQ